MAVSPDQAGPVAGPAPPPKPPTSGAADPLRDAMGAGRWKPEIEAAQRTLAESLKKEGDLK